MSGDKTQDGKLMTAVEEYLNDVMIEAGRVCSVLREHERKMTVAFPDGRVVTLVLYGPRGG